METISIGTSGGKASLVAFSFLQIVGQIGMVFIIFTAFTSSERVRRHPCFLNFAFSWFLYSVSYTLLLYGGELYNPNPSHGLCVAQTAFTYGTAPMASIASFMFVLQIYLSLKRILSNNVVPLSPVRNIALLSLMVGSPYVVLIGMLIAVPLYARRHPDDIQRLHFYCHVNNNSFGDVPPGLAVVGIIGALVILVLLGVKVYHNWRTFRRLDNASQDLTAGLIIRALIFTCFSIVAIILCAALISTEEENNMVASGIFLALLPVAVAIVFGIQRDLRRLLCLPSKKENKTELLEITRGIQVQLEVTVTQTVSKSSSL